MTTAYYSDDLVTLYYGDCLDVLRSDDLGYDFALGYGASRLFPDESVHAVVTDPPYALGFMGREWDTFGDVGRGAQARVQRASEVTVTGEGHSTSAGPYLAAGVDSLRSAGLPFQRWCEEWSRECLRVLKPGGYMLAFGGSRTWHRLASAVEDAGFEIRDSIAWLYGSGFPKSLDVSKAIDKAAGAERQVVGYKESTGYPDGGVAVYRNRKASEGSQVATGGMPPITAPATDAALEWEGWGTALKPAFEPIVVGRKPLIGTVAANVLEHGTGALNIDATRTDYLNEADKRGETRGVHSSVTDYDGLSEAGGAFGGLPAGRVITAAHDSGRWPTNVLLEESQADALDDQTGVSTSRAGKPRGGASGEGWGMTKTGSEYDDEGGASRFFPTFHYETKAPGSERPNVDGLEHPTVKPLDLMRWLVRLVSSPGAVILDPFAGSGTTLEAALIEGFNVIGIEREADYLPLIMQRITKPLQQSLFGDLEALA